LSRKIPTGSTKGRRIEFDTEKEEDLAKKEGKYKVRIVTKSSSASFPDVMRIVNRYSSYIEDELRYVIFDDVSDDLEELIDLSSSWKVFRFYIDDEMIKKDDLYHVKRALFCEFKNECDGICSQSVGSYNRMGEHVSINVYTLLDRINNIDLEDMWSVRRILEKKRWVKKTENSKEIKYVVDLEKLEDEVNSKYSFFTKYCNLYDNNKIHQEISKIKTKYVINKALSDDHISVEDFEAHMDEEIESISSDEVKQYLTLSEEQMDLLAKKISKEIEKVLKKLMKDKN